MSRAQIDQTAMGGAALQGGLKEALSNKSGVNARNSMTVTDPATTTKTSGGRKGFFGFKKGGIVPGKGNKDSVKAKLTPGELVIPKKSVSKVKKTLKGKAGAFEPLNAKKGPTGLIGGGY